MAGSKFIRMAREERSWGRQEGESPGSFRAFSTHSSTTTHSSEQGDAPFPLPPDLPWEHNSSVRVSRACPARKTGSAGSCRTLHTWDGNEVVMTAGDHHFNPEIRTPQSGFLL